MFYVSRDYENNTYGITDTSDNTEEIHSLNDILNIISSTGIKIHGVSKKGKVVLQVFKDLEALYTYYAAKHKLMGYDGVIKFDNGIIKLSNINNKNTTNYVVPDFIMSLGDNCFEGCSSLQSIKIPDSITSIGDNCFNGCSSLQSIEIPDSVTKIGVRCFCNCHSLKNITISKSLYNKSYIEHFIRFDGEIKFWA